MSHSTPVDYFHAAVRGMGDVHLAGRQMDVGMAVASFAVGREADPSDPSEHGIDGFSAEGLCRVFQLEPFLQHLLAVAVHGVVEGELQLHVLEVVPDHQGAGEALFGILE